VTDLKVDNCAVVGMRPGWPYTDQYCFQGKRDVYRNVPTKTSLLKEVFGYQNYANFSVTAAFPKQVTHLLGINFV